MTPDTPLLKKAEELLQACRAQGTTLALAESCTGGMIAATLTAIAGSSDVFMGAAITYSNNSKHELVDASLSTIDRYGAVSEQTAREMAYGTSLRFDCPLSASVTGIAGPNGGSDSKPVGTVHIATVFHGEIRHHEHHFKGDRHSIRKQATEAAIDMLLKALKA